MYVVTVTVGVVNRRLPGLVGRCCGVLKATCGVIRKQSLLGANLGNLGEIGFHLERAWFHFKQQDIILLRTQSLHLYPASVSPCRI